MNAQCHSLFQQLGIVHQITYSFPPQQNERVERKHVQFLNIARAVHIQASVPIRFWGDHVMMACYLVNLLPSKVLRGQSPCECLHKKPSHLDHLHISRYLCLVTMMNNADKFALRSDAGIFMGYSPTWK